MTVSSRSSAVRRARARVQGTVQGVGFRPFVYRLAGELGLAGHVFNDSHGVLLEVEGAPSAVAEFLSRLRADAPPLAVLERIVTVEQDPRGEHGFRIAASPGGGTPDAPVAPDSATCGDCLRELLDPADRRFRYPFINCTNCGPRFTIVRGVPYDRPLTTMAAFTMCERCRAEYEDPSDRRFHAQPNACPECGPVVRLLRGNGADVPPRPTGDLLHSAAQALLEGRIIAVKGVGGFHLACRADDEGAVASLRARKHREDKPFALMCPDLESAAALVELDERTRRLLLSPERPIVLAPRLARAPVAAAVAPGAGELGVMLAYSPLHHLLLVDTGMPLVMTSGNISDEPIAYRDEDAQQRFAALADLLLVHDRPIETRTDDSVVRVVQAGGQARSAMLRRSRGYVPASAPLPGGTRRPLLACGAELKNTFCVAKGARAWVGHHVGDLENYETLRSFVDGIEHFERLFAVAPEIVAHDLHPEYLSTKYAREREGVDLVAVQHHHAHLAACLAEHGETGIAVGAIFDGSGFGSDGTVWGGEVLCGSLGDFRRVGTLRPVRLPGGERAIRQPWRMACSWLADTLGDDSPIPNGLRGLVDPVTWGQVRSIIRSGAGSPLTSSMGRLFDSVAALCGICPTVNYEGQAAIQLEAACDSSDRGVYPVSLAREGEMLVLDPREALRAILAEVRDGVPVGAIAARFHATIAAATTQACLQAASEHGTEIVVLSGGVFQNRRLLEATAAGLGAGGARVLTPERFPANDGGISYGQAAVAAWRWR